VGVATGSSAVPRERCYFLHVPKCGGTSVIDALDSLFDRDEIEGGQLFDHVVGRPFQGRFVRGHFGLSAWHELGPDTTTFTVLREPHARTRSLYSHVRREHGHYFHERVHRRGYDFDSFVRDRACRPLIESHQARYLSLYVPRAWLAAQRSASSSSTPVAATFELMKMSSRSDVIAQTAIRNLGRVDVVGVTEDLPGFIDRVAACLGTAAPAMRALNASDPVDADVGLSSRNERFLRRLLEVDVAVYEEARRLAAPTSREAPPLGRATAG